MGLARLFGRGRGPEPPQSDTDTVRQIVARLESLPAERARFIAAFAYVLVRVAYTDREIAPEEVSAIEALVARDGGLPEDQAILVVQIAKSQNTLFGGTEDFLVTREFGRIASREERVALLDGLFGVAAAHGGIAVREENAIWAIAEELGMERADVVALRSKWRAHFNTLRKD